MKTDAYRPCPICGAPPEHPCNKAHHEQEQVYQDWRAAELLRRAEGRGVSDTCMPCDAGIEDNEDYVHNYGRGCVLVPFA